jgi:hypothetical protein
MPPGANLLEAAYARNPERFVRKSPAPPELPAAAWIDKPTNTKEAAHQIHKPSVSPGLTDSDRLRQALAAARPDEPRRPSVCVQKKLRVTYVDLKQRPIWRRFERELW